MNIYFTASTTHDGKLRNNYRRIILLIKQSKNKLLSGEQIVNEKLKTLDQQLTKKEIFQREKQQIEQADCLIAEVSQPSLGVGGEIVYALIKDKPVLALLFENHDDKISPMLAGNPSENLFLEHYNFEKLPYIIHEFLSHIKTLKKRKGYLIVIDGGDGSGKTTQATLLVEYLKKKKIPSKYVDFPQYYTSFHGKTVAKFLRGEFGEINQVSPYLASLAFALDRATVKREMEDFLEKGGYIVANRYATSSLAHHGAKFKNKSQQEDFLRWLYTLEYKIHKIPKEDLVIYLYVPWKIGMELTGKKEKRAYLKGKSLDIHEKDLGYRKTVEKMYLQLAQRYNHWKKINCFENGKILPPQVIHQKILQVLKKKKYLEV